MTGAKGKSRRIRLLRRTKRFAVASVTSLGTMPGVSDVCLPWKVVEKAYLAQLELVQNASTNPGDCVLDFFAGSGTTIAVAHKLKRKWIGIECGDYIDTKILKRMKSIVFGDMRPFLSKHLNWQGGGFFKYYELEQYEDTLTKVKYEDSDLFDNPYQDPYSQYVFMRDPKMLEALEIDYKNNKVKVDLSKLYKNIDIPETLSNLYGKWIKRITPDYVEFEDGEKINIKDLDYKLIKPLIWWKL